MKKLICLFICIINLTTLTGCDPGAFYYDYEYLNNNVVSIELINYENDEAVELFEKREKVKPFDFSKSVVIKVLDNEKISDFLLEFSEIPILQVWRHLDSPKGESIKINYKDGSFDVICCNVAFSCQYDKYGNVAHFMGSGGGNALVELINRSFS